VPFEKDNKGQSMSEYVQLGCQVLMEVVCVMNLMAMAWKDLKESTASARAIGLAITVAAFITVQAVLYGAGALSTLTPPYNATPQHRAIQPATYDGHEWWVGGGAKSYT
jgi:hypothetical protein